MSAGGNWRLNRQPGYWKTETSGVLRPVVEAYLRGEELTASQVVIMRRYLNQWIMLGPWEGPAIDRLRIWVSILESRAQIEQWIASAVAEGADPL